MLEMLQHFNNSILRKKYFVWKNLWIYIKRHLWESKNKLFERNCPIFIPILSKFEYFINALVYFLYIHELHTNPLNQFFWRYISFSSMKYISKISVASCIKSMQSYIAKGWSIFKNVYSWNRRENADIYPM